MVIDGTPTAALMLRIRDEDCSGISGYPDMLWRSRVSKRPSGASKRPREANKGPRRASKRPRGASKRPREANKRPREASKRPSGVIKRPRETSMRPPSQTFSPRYATFSPFYARFVTLSPTCSLSPHIIKNYATLCNIICQLNYRRKNGRLRR